MSETNVAEKELKPLSPKWAEVLNTIKSATILEIADFVKHCEKEFGVSAAVPMMGGAMMGGGAAAPAAKVEEKTTWDVVLKEAGVNKIAVIKEVRAVTNLGLKEAKDLVEAAPKTIKEGVSKEEAEDLKKKIEAAGAKVELK